MYCQKFGMMRRPPIANSTANRENSDNHRTHSGRLAGQYEFPGPPAVRFCTDWRTLFLLDFVCQRLQWMSVRNARN
jgi:hypothetical protein